MLLSVIFHVGSKEPTGQKTKELSTASGKFLVRTLPRKQCLCSKVYFYNPFSHVSSTARRSKMLVKQWTSITVRSWCGKILKYVGFANSLQLSYTDKLVSHSLTGISFSFRGKRLLFHGILLCNRCPLWQQVCHFLVYGWSGYTIYNGYQKYRVSSHRESCSREG